MVSILATQVLYNAIQCLSLASNPVDVTPPSTRLHTMPWGYSVLALQQHTRLDCAW